MSNNIAKMNDVFYAVTREFTAEQQRQFGVMFAAQLKHLFSCNIVNEANIIEHLEVLVEALESLKEDNANE